MTSISHRPHPHPSVTSNPTQRPAGQPEDGMPMNGFRNGHPPPGSPAFNNMVKSPFGELPCGGKSGTNGPDAGDGPEKMKEVFSNIYKEVLQKAEQTQDPRLKQRYQEQADVLKTMLTALETGADGQPPQPGQNPFGQPPSGTGAEKLKEVFRGLYYDNLRQAMEAKNPDLKEHYMDQARIIKATMAIMLGGAEGPGGGFEES